MFIDLCKTAIETYTFGADSGSETENKNAYHVVTVCLGIMNMVSNTFCLSVHACVLTDNIYRD